MAGATSTQISRGTWIRSSAWFFLGSISSRLIRTGVVILAARILGPSEWGSFSWLLGIAGILATVGDFNLHYLLMRESGGVVDSDRHFFRSAVALRAASSLLLSLPVMLCVGICRGEVLAAALIFGSQYAEGLKDLIMAIARSRQRFELEAQGAFLSTVGFMLAGLLLFFIPRSIAAIAFAYLVGSWLWIPIPLFRLGIRISDLFPHQLPTSFPWMMADIVGSMAAGLVLRILANIDLLLIGLVCTFEEVGLFAVAVRMIDVTLLIPGALVMPMLPGLALLRKNAIEFQRNIIANISKIELLGLFTSVLLQLLVAPFFNLVFGPSYDRALPLFLTLLPCMTITGVFAIASQSCVVLERNRGLVSVALACAAFHSTVGAGLGMLFGFRGVAVSSICAQLGCVFLLLRQICGAKLFVSLPDLAYLAGGFFCIIQINLLSGNSSELIQLFVTMAVIRLICSRGLALSA